jgi:hypothetical protein
MSTITTHHSTHTRDDDTISVSIDSSKRPCAKPCSQAKLAQLEAARKSAIEQRRRNQKERLEAKLCELRRLTAGMSDEHVTKFATQLLAQEETLRAKQNAITGQVNTNIEIISEQLAKLSTDVTYIKETIARLVRPR